MKINGTIGHCAPQTRDAIFIALGLQEGATYLADVAYEAAESLATERELAYEAAYAEIDAEYNRAAEAAFAKAAAEIGAEYERLVESGKLPRRVGKGEDILLTEAEQEAASLSLHIRRVIKESDVVFVRDGVWAEFAQALAEANAA